MASAPTCESETLPWDAPAPIGMSFTRSIPTSGVECLEWAYPREQSWALSVQANDGSDEAETLLPRTETQTEASHRIDGDTLIRLLTIEVSSFIDRIKDDLREDREDSLDDGDIRPTPSAERACLDLACQIARTVAFAPKLKSAAFTDEDGGVSLVLQSLVTDRRMNFRISSEGVTLSAMLIDENMQVETFPVSVDDTHSLRERAEWVRRRH